jgi:hypothetical protein
MVIKLVVRDPVKRLRAYLRGGRGLDAASAALADVIDNQLWRRRRAADGQMFADFGQLALEKEPYGLEVRTEASYQVLRVMLVAGDHYRELTDYVMRARRKRGHSHKSVTDSDRFLRISKSPTCIERMLLGLKLHHEELHETVCNGALGLHQAAVQAGLAKRAVGPKRKLRFGVVDLDGVAKLPLSAQQRLAVEVFDLLQLDAACTLLARRIDVVVGLNVAEQFRMARPSPARLGTAGSCP